MFRKKKPRAWDEDERVPTTAKARDTILKQKCGLQVNLEGIQKDIAGDTENRENPEINENQVAVEGHLISVKKMLRMMEIIIPEEQTKRVKVGNRVVLQYPGGTRTITLDGFSYGKDVCSLRSPLGQAIYGKKAGAKISINNQKILIQAILLPES